MAAKYLYLFEDGDMVQSDEELTDYDRQAHKDGVVTIINLETLEKIDGKKIRKISAQEKWH